MNYTTFLVQLKNFTRQFTKSCKCQFMSLICGQHIFLCKVTPFRKTKNRQNDCIHNVLEHVSMRNRHFENVVKKQRLEHPNALKRVYLQHLGTHCFFSKSTTQAKKCYQKATAWAPQKRTLFSIPKSKKRPNAYI